MIVSVSLADPAAVTLDDPSDLKGFHVAVTGNQDLGRLDTVLATTGAGRVDGEDAMVDVAWVRAQAAGRVGDEWEQSFAGMLDYARGKGWLSPDGAAIQGHVEWSAQ